MAVASVAIAAGLLMRSEPESVVTAKAPSTTSAQARTPLTVPTPPPDAQATPAPMTIPTLASVSKSDEFNRLVRSGKPADAYIAYKLAASCEATTAWAALAKQAPPEVQKLVESKTPESVCGDLSPGQRATRLELLRLSLEAGVHGALASLDSTEGPHGVLKTIPEGPEWYKTQRAAIDAAVKTADPYALLSRSSYYMNCRHADAPGPCEPSDADKAKALMYWAAYEEAKTADKMPPPPKSGTDAVVARYSKTLPPEVAQKAISDGKTLVATARGQQ